MTRNIIACSGLIFLLIGGLGAAQQQSLPNAALLETEEEPVRRYSVEMIVFEYVGTAAGTTEIFEPDVVMVEEPMPDGAEFLDDLPPELLTERTLPNEDPSLASEMAVDEDGDELTDLDREFVLLPGETLEQIPTYEGSGFVSVDPAEYQLQNAWDRLVRLDAYRPLLHGAWIQPTVEKDLTIPIPLRRIGNPPLRLNGTISLYLSRFLHMVVDLSLEHKSPQRMTATQERVRYYGDNQSNASRSFDPEFITPSVFYRIEEDRIVRNNELRYFDHPKFGVLAKITRIEAEVPEDLDTTDDLLPGNAIQ